MEIYSNIHQYSAGILNYLKRIKKGNFKFPGDKLYILDVYPSIFLIKGISESSFRESFSRP